MSGNFIPVTITPKAILEIKGILQRKGIPSDYGLRIGIKGNGCLGPSRILGFDKRKEGDMQFAMDGIEVMIRKSEVMYLAGLTLDFYEGADERGFQFVEPS